MKVAIVTVNFNGKKDTLELLESLKKLTIHNGQLKIIVVDNASIDGSVSEINNKFPHVDILQNGANEGFSGGYNRGMIYGYVWGADYILIINNDALIKDGNLLQSMISLFKQDEKIGIVSPKIYFAPGYEFHKDRYAKEDLGKVIWFAGGKFDWKNIHSDHKGIDEVDKGQFSQVEEASLVTGCCMMIKKEVLEKVSKPEGGNGFFDDKLFLYFEDNDFLQRAKRVGFKTYFDGRVSIYHKSSQTAGIGSQITDFFHTRNRLVLGFRYGRFRTKFALVREAIKFLFFGRIAQKKGVWDFFTGKRGSSARFIKEVRHEEYQKELSICIVNYNTADLTKKLLKSIFVKNPDVSSYQTPGVGYVQTSGFNPQTMEVIVLDNGNIDPSKEAIKEYLGQVKYFKNDENEGFSKGYNKTISYSKGRYILLLNSDVEVLENSLSEIVKWAKEFKDNAVLGGKLVFPDMGKQDSAFNLPTIIGALKEYFLGQKGAYFMYQPQEEKPTRVEGLVMACFLIPEKIVNKVGLLDEGTFIFFEDIEYCRRLKQFGVPIYFAPSAKFIHHHGASTKKQGISKSYGQLVNSSIHYHGLIYYWFLYYTLLFCQKFSGTRTPGEVR